MKNYKDIAFDVEFSEETQTVIRIAEQYVKEFMNESLMPEHLLKALLHKDVGLIDFLEKIDKDYYYLLDWAEIRIELLPKISKPVYDISVSNVSYAVLKEAEHYRLRQGDNALKPIYILASLVTPGVGFSFEQLKSLPLSADEILSHIDIKTQSAEQDKQQDLQVKQISKNLSKFTINKINETQKRDTFAIIGFEKELQTIYGILGKKIKSNVLIIGESGVGKTALIDAFIHKIIKNEIPEFLKNVIVLELDILSISSDANYKGEVEDRIKKVLTEISTLEKSILIIEGIDKVFEKQSVLSGISSILKKELNSNSFHLIATCSIEGFTKNIETDKEFIRKIEKLTIEEPDFEMTSRIIKGAKKQYEEYYHLIVPDPIAEEAIRLAKRFMGERSLPDSAFDLIDKTLSYIHTMNDISESEIRLLQEKLNQIKNNINQKEEKEIAFDLQWLHHEIFNRISFLLTSQLNEEIDFAKLTDNNDKINQLEYILQNLLALTQSKRNGMEIQDLSVVIAQQTGIPIGKVQTKERDKLINAESILKKRVVGQDHAIKIVLDAIYENRAGLNKKGLPIASVFFSGPTGTGKTELTKALAEFLFQDESAIIRFDMSEYMESHSVATMTGAPAGYVGYEEGGLLVNRIRQKPYSIVLFDEIEKAHPDVFNIFLQIMDEGKVHDKLNRVGDFSNSLIIFTSNVGSKHIFDSYKEGKIPSSNDLKQIMINHKFKPEFLGRLTEIIPFAPITEEIVLLIFNIHLKHLLKTLSNLNISLTISEDTKRALALSEFSPELGARPIIGIIRNEIRRPLSKLIISGHVNKGSHVELIYKDGQYEWTY